MSSIGSHLTEAVERYFKAVEVLQQFQTDEIINFLQENESERLNKTLQWVSRLPKNKCHLSLKTEHPEWFVGN